MTHSRHIDHKCFTLSSSSLNQGQAARGRRPRVFDLAQPGLAVGKMAIMCPNIFWKQSFFWHTRVVNGQRLIILKLVILNYNYSLVTLIYCVLVYNDRYNCESVLYMVRKAVFETESGNLAITMPCDYLHSSSYFPYVTSPQRHSFRPCNLVAILCCVENWKCAIFYAIAASPWLVIRWPVTGDLLDWHSRRGTLWKWDIAMQRGVTAVLATT